MYINFHGHFSVSQDYSLYSHADQLLSVRTTIWYCFLWVLWIRSCSIASDSALVRHTGEVRRRSQCPWKLMYESRTNLKRSLKLQAYVLLYESTRIHPVMQSIVYQHWVVKLPLLLACLQSHTTLCRRASLLNPRVTLICHVVDQSHHGSYFRHPMAVLSRSKTVLKCRMFWHRSSDYIPITVV